MPVARFRLQAGDPEDSKAPYAAVSASPPPPVEPPELESAHRSCRDEPGAVGQPSECLNRPYQEYSVKHPESGRKEHERWRGYTLPASAASRPHQSSALHVFSV